MAPGFEEVNGSEARFRWELYPNKVPTGYKVIWRLERHNYEFVYVPYCVPCSY